jgi:hypothetical protein
MVGDQSAPDRLRTYTQGAESKEDTFYPAPEGIGRYESPLQAIVFAEIETPENPPSGTAVLFLSTDGNLKKLQPDGAVVNIG